MNTEYLPGKLPIEHLRRLLAQYTRSDGRVVLGPGVGHDAAVISFGDRYLVAKTDPITFASDEIGWYAVHVNANDIACLGAAPRWFMVTLLLPASATDAALVDGIFQQIAEACESVGAVLVGGHTEVTPRLDQPVAVGCMLGEAATDRLIRSDGAQPGDALILTKGIAVEGTAILARELDDRLAGLNPSLIERSRGLLHNPGISVVRDAQVAAAAGEVHAMHDPTEGGLATALCEMALASDNGLIIEEDAIRVLPETHALCAHLGLDPLGLIASGALLIAAHASTAGAILAALERAGIPASRIGTVTDPGGEIVIRSNAGIRAMPRFDQDEITRMFP